MYKLGGDMMGTENSEILERKARIFNTQKYSIYDKDTDFLQRLPIAVQVVLKP
jgi:hypothetical protein